MKKRLLAVALCVAVVLALAAGCGKKNSGETGSSAAPETGSVVQPEESEADKGPGMDPQIAMNEGGVTVVATGLEMLDDDNGAAVDFEVENNSGQDICLETAGCAVNGWMMDAGLREEIAAGEHVNTKLMLYTASLEQAGIETIAGVDLVFSVLDAEFLNEFLRSEVVSLRTNAADAAAQTIDDGGEVLYEENGFKIVFQKFVNDEDQLIYPHALLYMENNTDKNVSIISNSTAVNGTAVQGTVSPHMLFAGAKAAVMLYLSPDELASDGIETIDSMEAKIVFRETDTQEIVAETPALKIKTK